MEKNNLFNILDARIMNKDKKEQIITVSKLAKRCLNLKWKKRPTMKEVTMELEAIQMSQIVQQNYEEVDCARNSSAKVQAVRCCFYINDVRYKMWFGLIFKFPTIIFF